MLETHVDDLNPEHFEYLMERLFEAGALDVALMHLQMKKNRPGFAIRVLARPSERAVLAGVLFAESTTLGVRVAEMERVVLTREERVVATPFGPIRVKFAIDGPVTRTPSAEYEDCKAAARRAAVPAARSRSRGRTSGPRDARPSGRSAAAVAPGSLLRVDKPVPMLLGCLSTHGLEGLSMGELPNAVVKRLLAQHGGGLRVSGSAIDEAVKATEDYLARLARESQALAVADKRKTVMDHDITKARAKIESGGL